MGDLRCYCCGTSYPWGQWRCCAPPAGTRSEFWMARYCKKPEQGGCGKCPLHCVCPKPAPAPVAWPDSGDIRERIATVAGRVLRSMDQLPGLDVDR